MNELFTTSQLPLGEVFLFLPLCHLGVWIMSNPAEGARQEMHENDSELLMNFIILRPPKFRMVT